MNPVSDVPAYPNKTQKQRKESRGSTFSFNGPIVGSTFFQIEVPISIFTQPSLILPKETPMLPAPLQALVDLPTHKARTQCVLDDLVPADVGERYDEGIDAECKETFSEPERIQSPFYNFRDWCEAHCALLQPFSNNWELAAAMAPEDSLWRKRTEAYRDLLWKSNPGKSFTEFCSNRDTVMTTSVFWPWVARTWRTLPKEVKDAFIAASIIRGISVVSTWTEHLWETDHPEAEAIHVGDIVPIDARVQTTTFGNTTVVGPLNPNHPVHRTAAPHVVTLAGWRIPLMVSPLLAAADLPQIYAYDRFSRVYFRIWVYKYNFGVLLSLLEPVNQEPVRSLAGPPRVRQKPHLPTTKQFTDDLLDSVASSHGGQTDIGSIASAIYTLRLEGFIHTTEDEETFIREYRAHCSRD